MELRSDDATKKNPASRSDWRKGAVRRRAGVSAQTGCAGSVCACSIWYASLWSGCPAEHESDRRIQ
eukprot:6193532-Pleurochrysis_carterae.AAC.3